MNRRDFLQGAVSSVLGSLMADHHTSESNNTDTDRSCDACSTLSEKHREWLLTPMTGDKRETFETLMRPEEHDWTEGCEYRRFADHEDVPYGVGDFREMDYEMTSIFHRGTLNVTVDLVKIQPVDDIAATIKVGDVR